MTWSIYENKYDLIPFIDKHPGGKEILQKTKDMGDITPLFESYHAFSNKDSLRKHLEHYKIEGSSESSYDFKLYDELSHRIKTNYNLSRTTMKATPLKQVYVMSILICYIVLSYVCLLDLNVALEVVLGTLLGLLWVSLGFNVMHDASHYALFRSPKLNNYASKLWHPIATWNHDIWFYQHVLSHHSFTNTDKDVDAHHLQPLLRKHKDQRRGWLPLHAFPLLSCIAPGFYFGQSIGYLLSPILFGTVLWSKLKIPRINYSIMDMLLILMRIKFFYEMGMWSSLSHMVANNLLYQANIVGDHDTYDVSVENHYEGNDWLKLQIQNSGNFKTDCPIYTFVFGGINYQIEHHLFPSMSNSYYSQIAPTVKEFCKEHDIPYVEHHSLLEVFQQYYKTLKYFNSKKNL